MNGQSHPEALRAQLGEASRVAENEPLAKRTTLGDIDGDGDEDMVVTGINDLGVTIGIR